MRRWLIPTTAVLLSLAGCNSSSSPNTALQQQLQSLQATVAALQARTPEVQIVTVTPSPTPSPSPTAIPAPKTVQLTGTITAIDCGGGYQIENANVTVTDENGRIIGAGRTGVCQSFQLQLGSISAPWHKADFSIAVTQANFYHIKIGTHDGPTHSLAEMEQLGWQLDLSL